MGLPSADGGPLVPGAGRVSVPVDPIPGGRMTDAHSSQPLADLQKYIEQTRRHLLCRGLVLSDVPLYTFHCTQARLDHLGGLDAVNAILPPWLRLHVSADQQELESVVFAEQERYAGVTVH